jgi:hypothetical protein
LQQVLLNLVVQRVRCHAGECGRGPPARH